MRVYFLMIALLSPALLRGGDWPQWRGPQRTGHAIQESPLTQLSTQPKTVWRQVAGPGLASPVVSKGRVYVFDNQGNKETVRALSAQSGEEIWRVPIDDPFTDTQGPTGPRCTLVVDGEFIYAQSSKGELQCLKDNGTKIWSLNYTHDFGAVFIGEKGNAQGATRHGNTAAPLISGDKLYVLAGGTNGQGVVCLEKRTGKVIWKSQNDQAGYAAPVLASIAGKEQVVAFTADGLIGLETIKGDLLWRLPVKTGFSRHVMTPIVFNDRVISGSHQSGLLGIKVENKEGAFHSTSGWTSKEATPNYSSAVAVGKHLYGLGPTKNLYCLDMETGKTQWSQTGYFTTSADKAHAGLIVVGENILSLTDTGEIILFSANPAEFKELGRAQVCGNNWCNPAYSDGKLFLRDQRNFLCVDLK